MTHETLRQAAKLSESIARYESRIESVVKREYDISFRGCGRTSATELSEECRKAIHKLMYDDLTAKLNKLQAEFDAL